jgi:NADH:ubiquinone oxidoreductase subunit 5 (subunit L)/multisubunit Na+/H+ antiporter MnhA subunit
MTGVAVVAMTAALLHVWNHALMKGLMFLAAGSVVHGAGTRDMEKLGGLMKRMPWTGGLMFAGAVALAALPPGNGFVSKFLIYVSLMKAGIPAGGTESLAPLLAVGLLALVGGMSVIVFVRMVGIVLLGTPRTSAAEHAHESSWWMLAPMLLLAMLCAAAAVVPQTLADMMGSVLDQVFCWDHPLILRLHDPWKFAMREETEHGPTGILGNINACFLIAGGAGLFWFLAWTRRASYAEGPTWGCGYAAPTARMQYTGRSFAEILGEHLLPGFLRPRTVERKPEGLFPVEGSFTAECPDPVSEQLVEPLFRRWATRIAELHILQTGKVHVYLIYIVLTVMLGLAWITVRQWW